MINGKLYAFWWFGAYTCTMIQLLNKSVTPDNFHVFFHDLCVGASCQSLKSHFCYWMCSSAFSPCAHYLFNEWVFSIFIVKSASVEISRKIVGVEPGNCVLPPNSIALWELQFLCLENWDFADDPGRSFYGVANMPTDLMRQDLIYQDHGGFAGDQDSWDQDAEM